MEKSALPSSQSTKSDSTNFDTLNGFAGYHLKRASNLMLADLNVTLKPFGLRLLTFTALVLIVDNPGIRLSQLATAMDVERPNMVVIIDKLESRDLINRDRVPTDRRAYALNVTLAGRQLCEKATTAVRAHEERLLHQLNKATCDTMIAALELIRRNDEGAET